jgi:hypothetical protein
MGISLGSEGLSMEVDQLFDDIKGKFIFNFLEDVLVYSKSLSEDAVHMREILRRLQSAGFTLNSRITIAAHEIRYLERLLSADGVQVLPDRIATIEEYPRPSKLRGLV